MTWFSVFRVKNSMLFANFISNAIGLGIVLFLISQSAPALPAGVEQVIKRMHMIFNPLAFAFATIFTLFYERPIRRYLSNRYGGKPESREKPYEARRRLLNEPFVMIALDLSLWLAAAFIYSTAIWRHGGSEGLISMTFFRSLITGLITSIVAFFLLEHVLQKRLAPHFFPDGGLSMTPKTLRIRIGTRLVALFLASNLIPFFVILRTLWETSPSADPLETITQLRSMVFINSIVFMGVGIWLTILVTVNFTRPLRSIIRVLSEVRQGNFEKKVSVSTNDEIGYTGDVINQMTKGLMERDFIKETFGKYVTPEIRDEILYGRISLDGETKEVTVLFADLRNFTPLVESTPPKEVIKILNNYFKEMEKAIEKNSGLVLQYIGDEIEAVFGAPLYRQDHPVMAARAALEMKTRLCAVNEDLKQTGFGPLFHGIGIHTGKVVAANIGSPRRLSYALVGDTVNLASRLQALNKDFGTEIIVSGSTRSHLYEGFSLKALPSPPIKGMSKPVEIYALLDEGSSDRSFRERI